MRAFQTCAQSRMAGVLAKYLLKMLGCLTCGMSQSLDGYTHGALQRVLWSSVSCTLAVVPLDHQIQVAAPLPRLEEAHHVSLFLFLRV